MSLTALESAQPQDLDASDIDIRLGATWIDKEIYQKFMYAGPLNMEFDYTALRDYRDRRGYTQQQVADAVGTSVRTYQKWEAGNTIPDGYFLLKLLNWLDIPDIQNIVKYK